MYMSKNMSRLLKDFFCFKITTNLHIFMEQVAFHRNNYNSCLIRPLLVWKTALEFVDLFCRKVFRCCRTHWNTSRSANCAEIIPWKRHLHHFVFLSFHGIFSFIKSKVFCAWLRCYVEKLDPDVSHMWDSVAVVMFSVNFMHPTKVLTGSRTENLQIFVAFRMLQVKGLLVMPNVFWDVS